MMPKTMAQRVDQHVSELAGDPALFGAVLDGLIEKKATEQVPAEVVKMAADIEKDTGSTKEAALRMAWESYVRYVNPEYFAKHAKRNLPPWLKKKDGKDGDKGKAKGKGGFGGKQAPPFQKKKAAAAPMSKEAQDLSSALSKVALHAGYGKPEGSGILSDLRKIVLPTSSEKLDRKDAKGRLKTILKDVVG
jgi:hypothetical protein